MIPHPPAGLLDILATGPLASDDMAILGGKAMHELDYSSRSLMQLCKTRCSIPRGYLIASALLP